MMHPCIGGFPECPQVPDSLKSGGARKRRTPSSSVKPREAAKKPRRSRSRSRSSGSGSGSGSSSSSSSGSEKKKRHRSRSPSPRSGLGDADIKRIRLTCKVTMEKALADLVAQLNASFSASLPAILAASLPQPPVPHVVMKMVTSALDASLPSALDASLSALLPSALAASLPSALELAHSKPVFHAEIDAHGDELTKILKKPVDLTPMENSATFASTISAISATLPEPTATLLPPTLSLEETRPRPRRNLRTHARKS